VDVVAGGEVDVRIRDNTAVQGDLSWKQPMQSTTAGPVTVERTSWEDAKAREQAGEDAFGWDAYRQECIRVNMRHWTELVM
jgi:hypothetical protein